LKGSSIIMAQASSPIKVAYILTGIDFGGVEKVSINFLKNYDRCRYTIIPISLIRPWEPQNIFIQKLKEEGFISYSIPIARRPRSDGRDWLRIPRCFWLIYNTLKKEGFDVVHTHGYIADIFGILSARLLGIPVISTCHGFISNNLTFKTYNALESLALRLSNRILAVSSSVNDDLVRRGIRQSRIFVVQNGIDEPPEVHRITQYRQETRKALNVTDEDYLLGYVGRLSAEKGVTHLVEALSYLSGYSHVSVKLVVIGTGPEAKHLADLANEKGITNLCIFAGFQTEIEKWLAALDVFVLPSLSEGTPMALLEAMSFGLPVVATKVGGIPRIIEDGITGLLVRPGDPKSLATAIMRFIDDKVLRQNIIREASNLVKSGFSAKAWSRTVENHYERLL
jgi:glycosyltransferase involved in cell wall biosynthesis